MRVSNRVDPTGAAKGTVQATLPEPHPSKKPKLEETDLEYQSAIELYDALQDEINSANIRRIGVKRPRPADLVNFRGCYCVVQDLAEPITKERVFAELERAKILTGLRVRLVLRCRLAATIDKFSSIARANHPPESGYRCLAKSVTRSYTNADALVMGRSVAEL